MRMDGDGARGGRGAGAGGRGPGGWAMEEGDEGKREHAGLEGKNKQTTMATKTSARGADRRDTG